MGLQTELDALHQEMRSCQKCHLRAGCQTVVPGEGSADASVAFFGEGPGKDEDELGRPFIGRSGQLLRDQCKWKGIVLAESYISNMARCRPPENRIPTNEEMEACWPWTEQTLRIIKPRVIVPLGRTALVFLAQKLGFYKKVGQNPILKLAGKPIFSAERDIYIYPIFHPAFACRNGRFRSEFGGHLQYLKLAIPGWISRPETGRKENDAADKSQSSGV